VKLVIDASVSLKWVLGAADGEHDVAKAEAVLAAICDGQCEAVQPPHWFAEVLAVIALKRRERIADTLAILEALPHRLCSGLEVYGEAARLSSQLKHHLFDTLYHAVALECGATLLTADEAYFAKARRLGGIKMLTAFDVT
jgi:predicted nucleic acid-binding protein